MKFRAKAKVISLERYSEVRSVAQTIRSGMIYQSLMLEAGETGMKDNDGYFGLVYSIPSEVPPEPFLSLDLKDNQLFLMIDEENDGGFSPVGGKDVERYEFYDMDTDDVHVMYRVPYKPLTLRPVK